MSSAQNDIETFIEETGKQLVQYAVDLRHNKNGKIADPGRRKVILEMAVLSDNIDAINELGYLLKHGAHGVVEDPKRAFQLFTDAASRGHIDANYNLGRMYQAGSIANKRNQVRAKELYGKAAEGGHEEAMVELAQVLEITGGQGVEGDPARAMRLYKHAASLGNENAMRRVAESYECGLCGVEQNIGEAIYWLKKAVCKRHERIKEILEEILKEILEKLHPLAHQSSAQNNPTTESLWADIDRMGRITEKVQNFEKIYD